MTVATIAPTTIVITDDICPSPVIRLTVICNKQYDDDMYGLQVPGYQRKLFEAPMKSLFSEFELKERQFQQA